MELKINALKNISISEVHLKNPNIMNSDFLSIDTINKYLYQINLDELNLEHKRCVDISKFITQNNKKEKKAITANLQHKKKYM